MESNQTNSNESKKTSGFSYFTIVKWIASASVVILTTVATGGISNPLWWFILVSLLVYGIACNLSGFKKGMLFGFEEGLKTGYDKGLASGRN